MGKPRKIARFISSLILTKALGLSSIATPMLGPTVLAHAASDPGWAFTGSLNTHRNAHTATLLPNGKVLVAGGKSHASEGILNSAELYDPAIGTWSLTGSLNVPRYQFTATLLPNGKVLVAGGISDPSSVTATAELYDPATETWSLTGDLSTTRFWHSATLLPNGKVLIAGGHGGQDGARRSAELYDPASGTWTVTGSLFNAGRAGRMIHTATLLQNGKVLVVGGTDGDDFEVGFSSAELYNPDTGTWSVAGSLNTIRALHTATLLQNGKVLVVGGSGVSDSAELYDPATNTWSQGGTLNRRSSHTATLLPAGQVLIAGGFDSGWPSLNSAELYEPHTGMWSETATPHTPRSWHTATPLQNGKVLIVGGFDSTGNTLTTLNSAELYDPGTTSTNPIDDPKFFVRQHYLDFLNREPDAPGLTFWSGEITECSDPAKRHPGGESLEACTERKRANTSAAFFLSPEFQNTGSFVLRVYWGTLGKLTSAPCPGVPQNLPGHCRPRFTDYTADMNQVAQGIVVNNKMDPAVINTNKRVFVDQFVNRADFKTAYPDSMSNQAFVDKLFSTTGITPSSTDRNELINGLNGGTETRSSVVFKVVDGTQTIIDGALVFQTPYGKAFYDQEFDAEFVFMQYICYLRRNPDQEGYNFWLAKLKRYGNWVDAQLVLAFIISPEYRTRFDQP